MSLIFRFIGQTRIFDNFLLWFVICMIYGESLGNPRAALIWFHPTAAGPHCKCCLFLPAFLLLRPGVTQHRPAAHRTRPQSTNSTTITSVLEIKNTFETTSHKYYTEETLLFSYDTFLVRLAVLSLRRKGLNPLTRPESTLTGLIQRLPGALSQVLIDWLVEMDAIWCIAAPLGI